jgi:hypothetical protein
MGSFTEIAMSSAQEIVPLRCSRCSGEFTPEAGGACAACGRIFCLRHLRRVKADGEPEIRCTGCTDGFASGPVAPFWVREAAESLKRVFRRG